MAQQQIVIDYSVPVRMRDGVTLWADVYRPAEPGRYPALLARTPYNRQNPTVAVGQLDISRAAKAGYAVVIQDVRGRWDSEGEFYTFANEINDGYDTVEWVAAQAWCSGPVGMFGASYVGATQWLAAIARPPHLSVIMPTVTGSNYHENWTYQGGAFNLGFNLSWTLNQLQTEALARNRSRLPYFGSLWEANFNAIDGLDEQLAHLPLHEVPGLVRPNLIRYYFDWLKHPNDDEYWHQWCIEDHYSNIEAPSFNIGGWYDIFLGGTLRNYTESRRLGGSERVRSGTRLVVGPWVHGSSMGNSTGEYDFGIRSEWSNIDVDGLRLRWLDHWLKDEPNSSDQEPPVKIFVMGLNRWRDEDDWPPAGITYVPYYLHQEGRLSPEKTRWGRAFRCLPVRPARSRADERRRTVLLSDRLAARHVRSARDRGSAGRVGLQHSASGSRSRSHRPDSRQPVGSLQRSRHRLHRQAGRRRAGRVCPEPDRWNYSRSLSQLAERSGADRAGPCIRVHDRSLGYQQPVQGRPSHPRGDIQQQFPALRPQP